ncbi:hypothetical protein PFFCH_00182 [Plasmodium falciparum FCH/4]|uniref:Secreted protein n=1 Tax=Plasmodium falciparum FCH/4 TaxID=1036724 RepID=A0A024VVV7_PLAFA|nr:hypothetical protein PFFCH_00182 [Plasmodium falciparum FCH/4]
MPFLLFSFFLFFLLINQKNNIESKRTNISKLKAFIVSPQKSKNKIIILNNKNSSIINNKVIKKNIQRNIFLKENIRVCKERINRISQRIQICGKKCKK